MKLSDYVRQQLEEAFGPENRWLCSQHHDRIVNEPDLLLEYFIKHGGAERFRRNFQGGSKSSLSSGGCSD